jgi:ubiquinone/menaquinone biosynthesis C-methylase UbiE
VALNQRDQRTERQREHFDRVALELGETGRYRTTVAGLRRMQRRAAMAMRLINDFEDPHVLEIGAGAGALSHFLLEQRPDLHLLACDVSPRCVEVARAKYGNRYPNARFEVADCTQLDVEEACFEVVCGCSILHHLPLDTTLKECHRVLKPGGGLWFSEPNMLNPQIFLQKNIPVLKRWLGDTEDETAFFRWKMTTALVRAGLTDIQVATFDFLHPSTPKLLAGLVDAIGAAMEHVPVVGEIAGSLAIEARKPTATASDDS